MAGKRESVVIHRITLKTPLTGKAIYSKEKVRVNVELTGMEFHFKSGETWVQDLDGLLYKKLDDGTIEWLGSNPEWPDS